MTFEPFGLSARSLRVLGELGFESPTPIQASALPLLLAGKDVIAQSRTGSGKTVAFTLPLLERLDARPFVQALVLCPTRELSAQVAGEVRKLGRAHPGLRVLELTGGRPGGAQAHTLRRGVHVVVGTPGRIVDHIERESLDLGGLVYVVLDEADRMLEMGFADQMDRIAEALRGVRQTVLTSATFPASIVAMSAAWQRDPVRVTLDEAPPEAIEAVAHAVEQDAKPEALRQLLAARAPASAIVFCNFKATVQSLTDQLHAAGFSVEGLTGDLEQRDRDRVMAKFRNESTRVLIATDVAARGIDVADVEGIVNYEVPSRPEVYVHRIGRTARAGKRGWAAALVSSRERRSLKAIEEFAGGPIERAPLPTAPVPEAPLASRMETLFISGGKKDKLRPGDILGALTGEAGGLAAGDIGRIEIHERFSYVAVARELAGVAFRALGAGRIKGARFRVERVA